PAARVTGLLHGTLTLSPSGTFAYRAAADSNAPDSFTYKANDSSANSATATVSLTVRPVNDAPVARDDTYATDEDTALTISVPGVDRNDTDSDSETLTAAVVTGHTKGTLRRTATTS